MEVNKLRVALRFVLRWEGGYVNDPKDPGGETNYGISKRSYPDEDIKNLRPERALYLYQRDYWNPIGGDNLPLPMCVVALDSAINCGVGRTTAWLRDAGNDWSRVIDLRVNHYIGLVKRNPTLQKFMKGWLNRTNDLRKFCENYVTSNET
jgi:lysozyme family protein